jgi:hypothetical protein
MPPGTLSVESRHVSWRDLEFSHAMCLGATLVLAAKLFLDLHWRDCFTSRATLLGATLFPVAPPRLA